MREGVSTVLLDLSKCYERAPLKLLAVRAYEAGWPGKVVALAIAQYRAVRFVSVAGATVPAGKAQFGMIPGCALAVKLLSAFLRVPTEILIGPPVKMIGEDPAGGRRRRCT